MSSPPTSRPSSIVGTPSDHCDYTDRDPGISRLQNTKSAHPTTAANPGTTVHNHSDTIPPVSTDLGPVVKGLASVKRTERPSLEVSSSTTHPSCPPAAPMPALATTPTTSVQEAKSASARKASTFRHVPLRNSQAPLPPSPLRPSNHAGHSRNVSLTSLDPIPPQGINCERQLPLIPPSKIPDNNHNRNSVAKVTEPRPRTTSLHAPPKTDSIQSSLSTSTPVTQPPLPLTPPSSRLQPLTSGIQRAPMPYPPGFQPEGLSRPLTDGFSAIRRSKRDGEDGKGMRRVERTKLERRLEKIITLHFTTPSVINQQGKGVVGMERRRPTAGGGNDNRRASSFFDFDLKAVSIADAGGLWRGVIGATESGKWDIRGVFAFSQSQGLDNHKFFISCRATYNTLAG